MVVLGDKYLVVTKLLSFFRFCGSFINAFSVDNSSITTIVVLRLLLELMTVV